MTGNVADLVSPLAFHAVHEAKELLAKAGFQEIKVSLIPIAYLCNTWSHTF